ncbi:glycosyltransferase family 4 protein [Roseomonas marmotae]|uniref:Glycosyltransferase family 4 protein n=1 Tax=Roseomonas marmotae TaxID=2768161 RepID=A0ABS3KH05_9PROT|nr:glycosyltransferase family 4 protein [Roseomonas marmotae]MBO1076763.1 glycosyltransferase family 4 protein [Roseomonas marmotae]QTI78709.1 glycosyltransferase family 4 protein [Roseomonas marmotae]
MNAPLLLHVFPSFGVGGAQVRFAGLANRFGDRWRHAVIALDGNDECLERIAPGVRLEMLPSPIRRGEALPRAMLKIGTMLRRLRPDLLVTSNWGSIEFALARLAMPGLPHLHTEDGFGPEESNGQLRRRILTRRIALRRSTVVLPSTILLRAALETWKLPASRVHHIPNGLDLGRFQPDGPTDPIFPGSTPLIGTVAALRPEKNLGRMLRASALLKQEGQEFRLAILGDGPERGKLEALVRELGLCEVVRFIGHVPDPAAAYRALDLFVLSSDTEQMPFSVLEAMATGLPVATTDAGDIRAMLPAENQPYIAGKDDQALADVMRPLLRDPALRRQAGQANRAKAERDYDQEAMFQAHADLIDRTRAART